MHGSANDRRALEREALRNVINQWNANRLDLFELSEPNEDLEFHGVMRFYFQDSGQKVATKCIRVASDATVEDVIGTLVEKFRPDMRMLSVPSYALYELHEGCPERRMLPDEKPLLVQLNWHVDDREGRFLLKNIDDKTVNSVGSIDSNASFRRKLSKREKKQLKKQEKLSRMKSENGDINNKEDNVAEKLYTELPETSFTRSISNPEAVMRRRRQQKLEKKLQQFRSKDGGPDTGGTLKIYGEALCKDVPYKTLLLSVRDCAGAVVREMLEKYGLQKTDPSQWCLVQVTQQPGCPDVEYVLDDDECPLSILMNSPNTGSIMFHVRRRPADCAPRKRKKKPGALGANTTNHRDIRNDSLPLLVELGPDGSAPHPGDTAKTIRLTNDVMEVGSANGIALQLYGPHIQPRHCVITNSEGVTSITPCHADAYTYVNGQRINQTTILTHGSLIKFGHSNTYRFLDPSQEERIRQQAIENARIYDSRSPRALSPTEQSRENIETTFDLEGNVETISTASGAREDSRSLGSACENRLSGIMDRYPRGQDPILPAVLEFPEEPQEQFLARVITHLDVTIPTFRLAPAYTLYLCARYRASTHYRPELTPTERAHKLTLLLQHAALLIRHTIQEHNTENIIQAFWLANSSELLHFLKSDRHVSAFSLQAQDILADSVQLAFKNLIICLTNELNLSINNIMSLSQINDDHPRDIINILSGTMNLLRKCRVNAALTIQLFSQLFHWISAKCLTNIISNNNLCTKNFGNKLYNRLRNLQNWAESQGLELAAECHLAKIVQCAYLLQAPKYTADDLAKLSSTCFKLNSLQLGALLLQYKPEHGEKLASTILLEQAAKAAENVADELAKAEGRDVTLYDDPIPQLQLLLPDDGFSCDVVQGVPPGLVDFLHPLQTSGLCRLAAQPTSSGHWTVYMTTPRPPSSLSTTQQPEIQIIRLHKAGGGMGLSIVAAKGAGQERLGIYIKSVVPGGAADRDGRLTAGDQLLSVDGQSLLGITQEKAAEFLVRTSNIVTLEVAKGGAVYHGLATLLQQPSPTPHRGPRRMSERDLPSKVDSERTIPSSKSVPALHHITSNLDQTSSRNNNSHDVFNPGYSRTSSNNSINTNSHGLSGITGGATTTGPIITGTTTITNGPIINPTNMRSRSTHNLHQQQDGGFYQNLSVYRNKIPSPQQLGDRASTLRSSQNSLQSTGINNNNNNNNNQRPSSAYYPPPVAVATSRPNLHQSIPNLKNPPPTTTSHRITNEDNNNRSGSYPNINHQQQYNQSQGSIYQQQQQQQQQNYQYRHEDINNKQQQQQQPYNSPYNINNAPYPSPTHQIHYHNGQGGYNNNNNSGGGGGVLREDGFRQSHNNLRHDEIMRYPSSNNIRIAEAQEMRISKSDDMLKQPLQNHNDIMRYASSGNIRAHESNKIDIPQLQQQQHKLSGEDRMHLRGQAKIAEMTEEVRRRQNRIPQQQQQQYYQQQQQFYHNSPQYNVQMAQNTQSMQNLNINNYQNYHNYQQQQQQQQNYYPNSPTSPTYKSPPIAPKPNKKGEEPPELPPTSTHPLYSASSQDPPKMAFYPTNVSTSSSSSLSNKTPRDPWAREEQERQAEARREASRQWQEQQIRELLSLTNRTPQQEEQLRVLQLEREFQRRAMEAAEQDDDDTEKESPSPITTTTQTTTTTTTTTTTNNNNNNSSTTNGAPPSILKPGNLGYNTTPQQQQQQQPQQQQQHHHHHHHHPQQQQQQQSPTEQIAPPPPERGSSFAVMSMRANRETTKRVSFNDTSAQVQPPQTLQIEEPIREDPNLFIRQAESMLASPTTPIDTSNMSNQATPGVIGAQEVYRDPRARRLAEQAQQKNQTIPAVPEKLSFKEKMKMFAMETGEQETPKDKSKISRAQREIDNLGSPPIQS